MVITSGDNKPATSTFTKVMTSSSFVLSLIALTASFYIPVTIQMRQQIVSGQQSCISELAQLHAIADSMASTLDKNEQYSVDDQKAAQLARDKVLTVCAAVKSETGSPIIQRNNPPWTSIPNTTSVQWSGSATEDVIQWSASAINDLSSISVDFFLSPF